MKHEISLDQFLESCINVPLLFYMEESNSAAKDEEYSAMTNQTRGTGRDELLQPSEIGNDSSSLVLDEDKYRAHLATLSLTREQEDALLQMLWSMMSTFVDLGFGLDPVESLIKEAAAKNSSDEEVIELNVDEYKVCDDFQQVAADVRDKERAP